MALVWEQGEMFDQTAYWNCVAREKTFSHPLDQSFFLSTFTRSPIHRA